MYQKRKPDEISQIKEHILNDASISIVVSPEVEKFLKNSPIAPNLDDINSFLEIYLVDNSFSINKETNLIEFSILEYQPYIRFRLITNYLESETNVKIRFRKLPSIIKDSVKGKKKEGDFWSTRSYMPIPKDSDLCIELYQACVLLRQNGNRPLPLLNENIVNSILNTIDGGNITNLKQFLKQFTKLETNTHGLLCYGPAGTGKTLFLKMIAKEAHKTKKEKYVNKFGMLIIFKGCGAHFEKKYVGEGEELLAEYGMIARKYPHMLCCMIVDEAEILVADRDSHAPNAEHKKGKVAILLDMLGGINNVPNLIMVGATNLITDIDPAMYRRFQMIFYGRMSKTQRENLIQLKFQHKTIYDLLAGFTISQVLRFLDKDTHDIESLKEFLKDIDREEDLEFCHALTHNLYQNHIDEQVAINIFESGLGHPLWSCLSEGVGKWKFSVLWGPICPARNDIPISLSVKFTTDISMTFSCLFLYLVKKANVQYFTALNQETVDRIIQKNPNNLENSIVQEIHDRVTEYETHYSSSLIVVNVDDLVGISLENNNSDAKTINKGVNPDDNTQTLTNAITRPINDCHNNLTQEDNNANFGKGLFEKFIGTNKSASTASQVLASQQAISQQKSTLIQSLSLAQYQSTSTKTVKFLRPFVMSSIINNFVMKAKKDKLIVILQFRSMTMYNYFTSMMCL